MTLAETNRYQTAEAWAPVQGPRGPERAPLVGDIHVLGVLVVVHFDDGRLLLVLQNAQTLVGLREHGGGR